MGRPPRLTPHQQREAIKRRDRGGESLAEGQQRMFSETHSAQGDMLNRDIVARMRHDGCGGQAGKVELLTGIEDASSRGRCGGFVLLGD